MWIMMNDSFLSIVASDRDDMLLVRARAKGDIEVVFPNAKVEVRSKSDYRFRAILERGDVLKAVAVRINQIDYGNFKSSVPENDRHDAYLRCWSAMMNFQESRLYRPKLRRAKKAGSKSRSNNYAEDFMMNYLNQKNG